MIVHPEVVLTRRDRAAIGGDFMAIWGRWTVGRLMLAVAAAAVLMAAGVYRWEHRDVDQAALAERLRALRRGDASTRRWAAGELCEAARDVEPAPIVAALTESAAGDDDSTVRQAAARALGRTLARSHAGRRQASGDPIEPDEGDLRAARVLLDLAEEPRPEARRAAVDALLPATGGVRWAAPTRPALLATLTQLLDDPDHEVRGRAAVVLGGIGPPAELRGRVVDLLQRDPDAQARRYAAMALTSGWPSPELYSIFLARYEVAPTEAERGWLLSSFWGVDLPPPPESAARLADFMATDPVAAQRVPPILARLGKAARPWVGEIARVAATELDGRPAHQCTALHALVRIDRDAPEAQEIAARLGRSFRDTVDEDRRRPLVSVLERYGSSAGPAVPALREALARPHPALRSGAARLLGGIGPDADPARPDLERMARDDPDPKARDAARRALDRLGPPASP